MLFKDSFFTYLAEISPIVFWKFPSRQDGVRLRLYMFNMDTDRGMVISYKLMTSVKQLLAMDV